MTQRLATNLPVRQWRPLTADLIWCYRGSVPAPDREQQNITVDNWVAWRLEAGVGRVQPEGGAPLTARSGQWIVLPPSPRQFSLSPRNRILSIHFRLEWGPRQEVLPLTQPIALPTTPVLDEAARRLQSVYEVGPREHDTWTLQPSDAMHWFRLQAAFYRWLEILAGALSRLGLAAGCPVIQDERLRRVVAWIERHSLERPPVLCEAARVAGLSISQLERLCSQQVGLSPRQIWERRRTAAARQAVETGRQPIKQIAAQFGFTDLSRFGRWFKRVTGQSPRAARASRGVV